MKKVLIIVGILAVGFAFLIWPMIKPDNSTFEQAKFDFKENLASPTDQLIDIPIKIEDDRISKLQLEIDGQLIKKIDNPKEKETIQINTGDFDFGTRNISLKSIFEDGSIKYDNRLFRVLSDLVPENKTIKIVQALPHKATSFTQGLEFYKGNLYEGTGQYNQTLIAEVDLSSGEHKRSMGLDGTYFGEGITILNDKLYQLTWHKGKCFVYGIEDFSKIIEEFNYQGEGWGLCNDGKSLIMSDGTERITFRNPTDFSVEKTIEVMTNTGPIGRLNELEYINGFIYANVWMTNSVVIIDPATGRVLTQIDCSQLENEGRGATGDVLNGIAYNPETEKLYLTGKNWPLLFEVEVE